MANFFEGLWNLAKHPIDEAEFMVKGARDVIKGDRSVGDLFGDHQEMMNKITVPLGGHNKLTENSDAVAGAIVGSVLAAPLIGGAMGGSSGAMAGGGAPVSSAVGQTPLEAILAGGGNAAEVGSVSTDGVFAGRFGRILSDLGGQMSNQSSAPQTTTTSWTGNRSSASAPSFQAYNQPQTPMAQIMTEEAANTGALNLDPFGFQNT